MYFHEWACRRTWLPKTARVSASPAFGMDSRLSSGQRPVGLSHFRLCNGSAEIDLPCFVPMRRQVSHGSVIDSSRARRCGYGCSRALGRAEGQDGSFRRSHCRLHHISPAQTLTAVQVEALSECEEFLMAANLIEACKI